MSVHTNIPHKILTLMEELINFCFKGGERQFIVVKKFGAAWTVNKNKYKRTFGKAFLKRGINFLFDNCPFDFGYLCFRQITAVPMGFDREPFKTNVFLHYSEDKWLLDILKRSFRKACLFRNAFLFIDDCCTIKDYLKLERNFKNIYPLELQLKKENISASEAVFLDFFMIIEKKKIKTQLYDKRGAFPFSIVCLPYLYSNNPSNIYYASIVYEILRFARTTLEQFPIVF